MLYEVMSQLPGSAGMQGEGGGTTGCLSVLTTAGLPCSFAYNVLQGRHGRPPRQKLVSEAETILEPGQRELSAVSSGATPASTALGRHWACSEGTPLSVTRRRPAHAGDQGSAAGEAPPADGRAGQCGCRWGHWTERAGELEQHVHTHDGTRTYSGNAATFGYCPELWTPA